jgi:hypothetical protein
MKGKFSRNTAILVMAGVGALFSIASPAAAQLLGEPSHETGQAVTGAFEGWWKNADGSYSFLFGYYNRNTAQEVDIPIGPNNKFEPLGPDNGQPTHFGIGRGWGVFTAKVPADFGDKKLTWTLTYNGKTTVVPSSLDPLYLIRPFKEDTMNNTPPRIRLDAAGEAARGPGPSRILKSVTAKVGTPLTLDAFVEDDAKQGEGSTRVPPGPPATARWTKFRGPGDVKFATRTPKLEPTDVKPVGADSKFIGKATTTATFSQPGEYVLLLSSNDWSGEGGGGFLCCWSNAELKVTVQ